MAGPSKGVDYYCFRSTENSKIVVHHPTDLGETDTTTTVPGTGTITHSNIQISESDIGIFDHTGRFSWEVYDEHNPATKVLGRYADIAPSTGNLGESNMKVLLQTPSLLFDNCAVSYGFYDASTGLLGLTNQDQAYVYVTERYGNWMHELAGTSALGLATPLHHFVLAGAHDAGMYDVTTVHGLCHNPALLAAYWAGLMALEALELVLGGMVTKLAQASIVLTAVQMQRALVDFAFTQKDTVGTLLDLGVRYFDFRPGYCFGPLQAAYPGLYHQHAFVPGVSYATFLDELLSWLTQHPTEVVVVALGFAGFVSDGMKPSTAVLSQYLSEAQRRAGTSFNIGNATHLHTTYEALLQENRRLVLLNQTAADYYPATKYDSYSSKAYKTTSAAPILNALNGMTASEQPHYDYTVLQLQGTVTGTLAGMEGSVFTGSDAAAPLLSTKPGFDRETYHWVQQNAARFANDHLLVLLNDFADNALVWHGRMATQARLGP